MPFTLPAPVSRLAPILLPFLAILIARTMTYTDWAEANAGLAAIVFAWIVADALLLGLLAKAPRHRPSAFAVCSRLALAALVIVAGAGSAVRAVYFDLPQVLVAAGSTLAIFIGWSAITIIRTARASRSWVAGIETVLPGPLIAFARAEIRVVHLGLLRWNAPVDTPPGWRAFAYHTYLTPMLATFLVLQLIELFVVHLLVMLWNPIVAWVLLGLSAWGVVWTMALIKSFRINPVLLSDEVIRVRSGLIHDFEVPRETVGDMRAYGSEELKGRRILDLAIMSAPNVSLRFSRPIAIRTLFGAREIDGVALRLDDSAAFLAAVKVD